MIAEDKKAFSTAFEYIIRDFAAEDPVKMSETAERSLIRNNLLYG